MDHAACGLLNPGNLCYLNALLECLARIVGVRAWTSQHLANMDAESHAVAPCVLCDLDRDLYNLVEEEANTCFLARTVQHRPSWHRAFANDAQHDISEAFAALLHACDAHDVPHFESLFQQHGNSASAQTRPALCVRPDASGSFTLLELA